MYKSNSTNRTYAANTNPLDQKAAEQVCNDLGGHLVSWSSYEEQFEVEQYYIKQVRPAAEHGTHCCTCCATRSNVPISAGHAAAITAHYCVDHS